MIFNKISDTYKALSAENKAIIDLVGVILISIVGSLFVALVIALNLWIFVAGFVVAWAVYNIMKLLYQDRVSYHQKFGDKK